MAAMEEQECTGKKWPLGILVVGDWVVDEHWATGIHRSPTASRKGRAHYRCLHTPCSAVQSLAGAGRVASVLHQARVQKRECYEITCIGTWHTEDGDTIRRMLDPTYNQGQTPFRLTAHSGREDTLGNESMLNLNDYAGAAVEKMCGTNRVFRTYQHAGASIQLLDRIDWEIPCEHDADGIPDFFTSLPGGVTGAITEKAITELKQTLSSKKVDAVVVYDMCKGTVNRSLIRLLAELFRDKEWYLSSKAWPLPWAEELKGVDLRLLLVHQIAAQTATRISDLSWITDEGQVSEQAMKALDDLVERVDGPKEDLAVVVLLAGSRVLARYEAKHTNPVGYIEADSRPSGGGELEPVAMASVFMPALVAHMICDHCASGERRVAGALAQAFAHTRQSMATEINRVKEPETWEDKGMPQLTLLASEASSWPGWKEFDWVCAKTRWTEAFSGCGIIEGGGPTDVRHQIQLWRAMMDLDGCVCVVPSKRRVLHDLVKLLDAFERGRPRRHVSCMLVAPPGAGKNFIVKLLTKSFGFGYLPFNITQLHSRREIFDCFDTITAAQAERRGEPMLVFVDEINAKLDNQEVFGSFLGPLEEGAYVRSGKTFHIDPCVWMFAGTRSPEENSEEDGQKASDFLSRLTVPPLKFCMREDELTFARIEKVYIGVALICRVFPDVRLVSEKVLRLFHELPVEMGVREVEHFVRKFGDVQYGKVMSRNVPMAALAQMREVDVDIWEKMEEGRWVEIVDSA